MNFTGSVGSRRHGNSEELNVVGRHCFTFRRQPSVAGAEGAEGMRKEEVRKTRQPLGCQLRPSDGRQRCTQVELAKKRKVSVSRWGERHQAG